MILRDGDTCSLAGIKALGDAVVPTESGFFQSSAGTWMDGIISSTRETGIYQDLTRSPPKTDIITVVGSGVNGVGIGQRSLEPQASLEI